MKISQNVNVGALRDSRLCAKKLHTIFIRLNPPDGSKITNKEGLNGGGGVPLVACRLKFSYFVGSWLKFSVFVGCRLISVNE